MSFYGRFNQPRVRLEPFISSGRHGAGTGGAFGGKSLQSLLRGRNLSCWSRNGDPKTRPSGKERFIPWMGGVARSSALMLGRERGPKNAGFVVGWAGPQGPRPTHEELTW